MTLLSSIDVFPLCQQKKRFCISVWLQGHFWHTITETPNVASITKKWSSTISLQLLFGWFEYIRRCGAKHVKHCCMQCHVLFLQNEMLIDVIMVYETIRDFANSRFKGRNCGQVTFTKSYCWKIVLEENSVNVSLCTQQYSEYHWLKLDFHFLAKIDGLHEKLIQLKHCRLP